MSAPTTSPHPTLQVFPVIHINRPEQAYENAELAFKHGCPGVFLISMDGRDDAIDPIGHELVARYPDKIIGVNYLSKPAEVGLAHSLAQGFKATWSDAPGVRSDHVFSRALDVQKMLQDHPDHLFFGSVAFKYQPADPNPAEAVSRAFSLGMIPTTSGEATGKAPPMQKLFGIRASYSKGPLALASGVTPENVRELGSQLTHVLVATGISRDDHEFDELKLTKLMAEVALSA